jgi:VWFA-related protein
MLLILLLLPGSNSFAQEPAGTVFQAGVSLVRIDAQVVSGNRTLSGLTAEDFVVKDEGTAQQVKYFGRDSEPLWVLLLLDVSGSMKKRVAAMAEVAREALKALSHGDQVAVMFFGRTTKLEQEFTENLDFAADAVGEALEEKTVGSGTAINPAVLDAASYVRRKAGGKAGRRAIVILTDNSGLNYQTPDEVVLGELQAGDTVLNAIITQDARPPKQLKKGEYQNPDFTPSDVFKLSLETGGEVMKADRADEAFQQMMRRIRTRYSIHYVSPGGERGQRRKVEVALSNTAKRKFGDAEVRARSGYRVPE